MNALRKITKLVSQWMAVIVIVVAAAALFAPQVVGAVLKTKYVNNLLGIIM